MWKKLLVPALIVIVAAGLIIWLAGPSQKQPKNYRIGIIKPSPSLEPAVKGFKSEMAKLGYKEGVNLEYVAAEAAQDKAATEERLKALIESPVDLIVVTGVRETRSIREATEKFSPSLPVVFGVVSDPVGSGVVKAIQSSGNNLTGVTPANEILVAKRAKLVLGLVPSAKRLVMAWNNPNTSGIENLRAQIKELGVELFDKKVNDAKELDNFLATFRPRPGDIYIRATDTVSADRVKEIVEWGLKNKVPVSGTNIGDAERGAFMSYGADYESIGFQVARLADRIFKGAKPSELPIEPPGKVELIVNSQTAEKLGITIPQSAAIGVNKFIK
ncbi:MAG: ABC transporter substrate-binding protein [Candidatus Giovannonibacteria bacterium]|nr:MAG: ABC transporter substrate-binding protein [Candidatus Giovannonibacteria bacterium]